LEFLQGLEVGRRGALTSRAYDRALFAVHLRTSDPRKLIPQTHVGPFSLTMLSAPDAVHSVLALTPEEIALRNFARQTLIDFDLTTADGDSTLVLTGVKERTRKFVSADLLYNPHIDWPLTVTCHPDTVKNIIHSHLEELILTPAGASVSLQGRKRIEEKPLWDSLASPDWLVALRETPGVQAYLAEHSTLSCRLRFQHAGTIAHQLYILDPENERNDHNLTGVNFFIGKMAGQIFALPHPDFLKHGASHTNRKFLAALARNPAMPWPALLAEPTYDSAIKAILCAAIEEAFYSQCAGLTEYVNGHKPLNQVAYQEAWQNWNPDNLLQEYPLIGAILESADISLRLKACLISETTSRMRVDPIETARMVEAHEHAVDFTLRGDGDGGIFSAVTDIFGINDSAPRMAIMQNPFLEIAGRTQEADSEGRVSDHLENEHHLDHTAALSQDLFGRFSGQQTPLPDFQARLAEFDFATLFKNGPEGEFFLSAIVTQEQAVNIRLLTQNEVNERSYEGYTQIKLEVIREGKAFRVLLSGAKGQNHDLLLAAVAKNSSLDWLKSASRHPKIWNQAAIALLTSELLPAKTFVKNGPGYNSVSDKVLYAAIGAIEWTNKAKQAPLWKGLLVRTEPFRWRLDVQIVHEATRQLAIVDASTPIPRSSNGLLFEVVNVGQQGFSLRPLHSVKGGHSTFDVFHLEQAVTKNNGLDWPLLRQEAPTEWEVFALAALEQALMGEHLGFTLIRGGWQCPLSAEKFLAKLKQFNFSAAMQLNIFQALPPGDPWAITFSGRLCGNLVKAMHFRPTPVEGRLAVTEQTYQIQMILTRSTFGAFQIRPVSAEGLGRQDILHQILPMAQALHLSILEPVHRGTTGFEHFVATHFSSIKTSIAKAQARLWAKMLLNERQLRVLNWPIGNTP